MCIRGDGHVHLHATFALGTLFEAVARRARRAGSPFLLLLAEVEGIDAFASLERVALGDATSAIGSQRALDPIRVRKTGEPESLAFRTAGSAQDAGYVVAGRQLVSSEGIEVLAIASRDAGTLPADGRLPARELVAVVRAQGAAAVLPWGLGKWLGARGARVAELVHDPELAVDPLVLLGDTAHRFWPWPEPAIFRGNPRVLAGTDPLPTRGAERRVGAYGFRVAGRLDADRPARSLLEALRSQTPIERVGAPHAAARVLADQLEYRWKRRRGGPRKRT